MGEVEGISYKDGSRTQVVQKYRDEASTKPISDKPLKYYFLLPLELEHCSFSIESESYLRRITHFMKVSGIDTAYCSSKKGCYT